MCVSRFVFEAAFASGLASPVDDDVPRDTGTAVWKARPNSVTLEKRIMEHARTLSQNFKEFLSFQSDFVYASANSFNIAIRNELADMIIKKLRQNHNQET